ADPQKRKGLRLGDIERSSLAAAQERERAVREQRASLRNVRTEPQVGMDRAYRSTVELSPGVGAVIEPHEGDVYVSALQHPVPVANRKEDVAGGLYPLQHLAVRTAAN